MDYNIPTARMMEGWCTYEVHEAEPNQTVHGERERMQCIIKWIRWIGLKEEEKSGWYLPTKTSLGSLTSLSSLRLVTDAAWLSWWVKEVVKIWLFYWKGWITVFTTLKLEDDKSSRKSSMVGFRLSTSDLQNVQQVLVSDQSL